MTQTAAAKLELQIKSVEEWMVGSPGARCRNMQRGWWENAHQFLLNMAEEVPEITAWNWLSRAIKRYESNINKPFGFVKAVLRNPWGSFPEDRIRNALAQEKDRTRRAYQSSLHASENSERAGSPSSYPSPASGCICKSDCGGANALCHVANVKIFGCRAGDRCMPCGLAATPA